MTYPPDFTFPSQKSVTAQCAAAIIAGLCPTQRVVVQAGGCSGLWPLALAKHFDRVYTFEPDPTNFRCLQTNVVGQPTISARGYALGETERWVGLTRPKAQAGLWTVSGVGEIPMVRLDDVIEGPVDAIVLDVEGSEVPAWRGAERVITEHRPMLWFEYIAHAEAMHDFLAAHGYVPPMHGFGGDWYSVHSSRVVQ